MSTKSVTVSCLALALFAVALRDAVALSYTVSGGSVLANQGDGLIVNTSLSLPSTPFTFNLIDGQSETFSFFKIWTEETTVNPDDEAGKSISATLYFSDPPYPGHRGRDDLRRFHSVGSVGMGSGRVG